MPLVLAITGKSDAGKTFLIKGLVPEMKERGYKLAAIKHCPHGFDLDVEGKDSWHLTKAGAEGVLLRSPAGLGLIRVRTGVAESLDQLGKHYFPDCHLVLAEGFARDESTRAVEVLRKGVHEQLELPPERLLAVVADFAIRTDTPVFNPNEISRIADFLERLIKEDQQSPATVQLSINGDPVFLNEFVQSMIEGTVTGLIAPLKKRDDRETREIEIRIHPPGFHP
jgi:molybdopterin-guanine dinucleotide biosynthesis protein MobB